MNNLSNEMDFNSNSINSWSKTLKDVASEENRRFKKTKRFIVLNQRNEATAVTMKEFNPLYKKLSVDEIVDISLDKIKKLSTLYENSLIDRDHFFSVSEDIKESTLKIIQSNIQKNNKLGKRIVRKIHTGTLILLSFTIVGIPVAYSLYNKKRAKGDAIKKLNEQNFTKIRAIQSKRIAAILAKEVPNFIDNVNEMISNDQTNEIINDQFKDDLRSVSEKNPTLINQFVKDVLRGTSFTREDTVLGIKDEQPNQLIYTNKDTPKFQDVEDKLLHLLNEITIGHDTKIAWQKVIQLPISQTSLNSLFSTYITNWLADFASKGEFQWVEKGNTFAAKLDFPNQQPPIKLNIVRDPVTKQIQQIDVFVGSFLNIVAYNTSNTEENSILVPKPVYGELSYSIKLDENDQPVVFNTQIGVYHLNDIRYPA